MLFAEVSCEYKLECTPEKDTYVGLWYMDKEFEVKPGQISIVDLGMMLTIPGGYLGLTRPMDSFDPRVLLVLAPGVMMSTGRVRLLVKNLDRKDTIVIKYKEKVGGLYLSKIPEKVNWVDLLRYFGASQKGELRFPDPDMLQSIKIRG